MELKNNTIDSYFNKNYKDNTVIKKESTFNKLSAFKRRYEMSFDGDNADLLRKYCDEHENNSHL